MSTLHTEVAAAAFLRRRYGSAFGSFLKALYHRPIKRADHFRRIFRAAKNDLVEAIVKPRAPTPPGRKTPRP